MDNVDVYMPLVQNGLLEAWVFQDHQSRYSLDTRLNVIDLLYLLLKKKKYCSCVPTVDIQNSKKDIQQVSYILLAKREYLL